jgi:hypothetical protein
LPPAILLSCLALGACGGSSHPAAKSAAASTTSAAQTVASVAATTAQNGATGGTGSNGGTHAGGTQNPTTPGGGPTSPPPSSGTPPSQPTHSTKFPSAVVAALENFAHCVRSHGLNIAGPNLSGHGEIFSSKGVNPNSPQYRSALEACESYLLAILRSAGGSHIHGIP